MPNQQLQAELDASQGKEAPKSAETVPSGWSILQAMAMCHILPAATARHTQRLSLRHAFGFHIIGISLAVWLILIVIEWASSGYPISVDGFLLAVPNALNVLIGALPGDPWQAVGVVLLFFVGIESAHLALAMVLAAWGAADEPARDSIRHALRIVWLFSIRYGSAVVLAGVIQLPILLPANAWLRANRPPPYPLWPAPVSLAETDPGYAQAKADYEVARQTYREQMERYKAFRLSRPWFVKAREMAAFPASTWVIGWLFWGLFRGIGAMRAVKPLNRPPICDDCGYNLSATRTEGRCPECGLAVIESLGTDMRMGTSWNRISDRRSWWATSKLAAFKPRQLGQQLAVTSHCTAHRRFLFWNLALVGVMASLAFPLFIYTLQGVVVLDRDLVPMIAISVAFMSLIPSGMILFLSAIAGLLGLNAQLRYQRNLMASAIQVMSYLSTYVSAWGAFVVVWTPLVATLGDQRYFRAVERVTGLPSEFAGFLMWALPNVAWLVIVISKAAVGVAATRYANK